MDSGFVVAIASGKGGAGKTTIAVNLARVAELANMKVRYVDCDVEEPDGHIFLKPSITHREVIYVDVPQVDEAKCIGCGKCERICRFNAIVCLGTKNIVTFEQLCHSCGGCSRVCPSRAITTKQSETGTLESGWSDGLEFLHGRLKVGNIRTPYLISRVKDRIEKSGLTILDAPPGTSCAVVETLRGADMVILVTEPTPFGLNDLKLSVELANEMRIPASVVINRKDGGADEVERYCRKAGVAVVGVLEDNIRIGRAYSRGQMIATKLPQYRKSFDSLLSYIKRQGCFA